MADVLEKLGNLRVQAMEEKSHFYTAEVLHEAMSEIVTLRYAFIHLYEATPNTMKWNTMKKFQKPLYERIKNEQRNG